MRDRNSRYAGELKVLRLLSVQINRVANDLRDRTVSTARCNVTGSLQTTVFEPILVGQIDARIVDSDNVFGRRRLADLIAEKEDDAGRCCESNKFLTIRADSVHRFRSTGERLAEELRQANSVQRDKRFRVGRLRRRGDA